MTDEKEMNSGVQLEIKSMKIGGYSIPVPVGLADLLNEANAWGTMEEKPTFEGYKREVIMEDGKLITRFTKIE